jgi:hypothetical protein
MECSLEQLWSAWREKFAGRPCNFWAYDHNRARPGLSEYDQEHK